MQCRRSVIRVHPGNVRDSVVLDAKSANSVSKISYFCQQIIYQLEESIMKATAPEEEYALRKSMRIFKKYEYTYTRDFKKDGLSKPKILIHIIKQELERKYPDLDFSCFLVLIHQNIELDTDIPGIGKKGDLVYPKRGHSLGMGNELTTLVQCIISRIVKNSLQLENKISVDVWNDDFRCHGCLEDVRSYRNRDLQVVKDLDYPLSGEKTRILYGATVFLEEYSFIDEIKADYSKDNRKICLLANILFARNIYEAKEYSRAVYEDLSDLFIRNSEVSKIYMEIITLWGYEFNKAELILPARLGGWYTCKYMFLDETFNLRAFNELDLSLLTKLARAEEASVNLNYKKTYAFSKYSNRQLVDRRTLTDIERLIAPHGDILLSNFKSIASMTEQGLIRSRISDLYFDLLLRERSKVYNSKIIELGRGQLIQSIISYDRFKSYAIPEAFIKGTNSFFEDYTYTSFSVNFGGLLKDIQLEWKYLDDQELTLIEKCRLISKSRLIKYTGGLGCEAITPFDDAVDRKVLKYHNNYMHEFLYYVYEYGYIPERIYLELPDKFDQFNLSESEFDTLTQLQNYYPKLLDHESSFNLDRFRRYHNLEIQEMIKLYKKLDVILKRLDKASSNKRLIVKKTFDIEDLFHIVAEEPKEYSKETDDNSDRAEVNDIEIEILPNDEISSSSEEFSRLQDDEHLEFVYDVSDDSSYGSDYDWGTMDCDILYGI
jgi:hypothetical protein